MSNQCDHGYFFHYKLIAWIKPNELSNSNPHPYRLFSQSFKPFLTFYIQRQDLHQSKDRLKIWKYWLRAIHIWRRLWNFHISTARSFSFFQITLRRHHLVVIVPIRDNFCRFPVGRKIKKNKKMTMIEDSILIIDMSYRTICERVWSTYVQRSNFKKTCRGTSCVSSRNHYLLFVIKNTKLILRHFC